MKDVFETKKVRMTIKSPVHIGSIEQKITSFEFIHQGQWAYPISDERLAVFVQTKKLIDSYIVEVERQGKNFRLLDFLKTKNISPKKQDLLELSAGRKTKVLGNSSIVREYRPFVRDGFGKIYIPGTSIKGAIRTAILFNALMANEELKEKVEQKIEQTATNEAWRFKKDKKLFEWVQTRLLEDFNLIQKSKSPNTDWLRMLHVSDAYPVDLKETNLIPINVLKKGKTGWSYKTVGSGKNMEIWIETVPQGTLFQFDMTFDKNLLERFKDNNKNISLPQSIDEVIGNIKKWSDKIVDYEKNDFSKGHSLETWYKTNNANFRIGFGSGMASTTIALLLDEKTRKLIRNLSGQWKGDDIAPKSRRVWVNNGQVLPLGWADGEVFRRDEK